MKKILSACVAVLLAVACLPALAQVPLDEQPMMEEPGEFTTRMVIDTVFNQPVVVEKGLNLGTLSVQTYKSGNQSTPGTVSIPGAFSIKPVVVEMGWHEAEGLIRWFNRIQSGKQERHDIQLYVRRAGTMENHLHITLFGCWPSDITLKPFGDNLPTVSVTFQVQRLQCHLPPVLKPIEGAKVIHP